MVETFKEKQIDRSLQKCFGIRYRKSVDRCEGSEIQNKKNAGVVCERPIFDYVISCNSPNEKV